MYHLFNDSNEVKLTYTAAITPEESKGASTDLSDEYTNEATTFVPIDDELFTPLATCR